MRTIGFTEVQTDCVSEPLPEITKETEIPDVTDEAAAEEAASEPAEAVITDITDEAAAEDTAEEPAKAKAAKRRQKKTEDADETAGNA
ncbi:MAG: hypothetical protein ACI4J7_08735 [Ruminiclostridium sp.]